MVECLNCGLHYQPAPGEAVECDRCGHPEYRQVPVTGTCVECRRAPLYSEADELCEGCWHRLIR